jgi:type I restriction enzyme S subunit
VHLRNGLQPSLNRNFVYAVKIRFPDPRTQKRVADILSAYDDLIENNRRRMALLEEAARQLYREWFVRLRFPGHEHTRFTDGVPDRWERCTFADACESLKDGDWIESKTRAATTTVCSKSRTSGSTSSWRRETLATSRSRHSNP